MKAFEADAAMKHLWVCLGFFIVCHHQGHFGQACGSKFLFFVDADPWPVVEIAEIDRAVIYPAFVFQRIDEILKVFFKGDEFSEFHILPADFAFEEWIYEFKASLMELRAISAL